MVGYWRYDTTCIHSAKAGDCEETKLSHKPSRDVLVAEMCYHHWLPAWLLALGFHDNCKSSMDIQLENAIYMQLCEIGKLRSLLPSQARVPSLSFDTFPIIC